MRECVYVCVTGLVPPPPPLLSLWWFSLKQPIMLFDYYWFDLFSYPSPMNHMSLCASGEQFQISFKSNTYRKKHCKQESCPKKDKKKWKEMMTMPVVCLLSDFYMIRSSYYYWSILYLIIAPISFLAISYFSVSSIFVFCNDEFFPPVFDFDFSKIDQYFLLDWTFFLSLVFS